MPPRRPCRAALCAGAALAAAAAAPAGAAELTFRFDGRGWGHGVGMSQYGAQGYALQGWGAAQILAHYYPGTALTTSPATTVRVLLSGGVPAVTLTPSGGPATVNVLPGNAVVPLADGATYTVRAAGGGVRVEGPGGAVVAQSAVSLRIDPSGGGIRAGASNYLYPGELVANPAGGGLNLINAVDRETYLRGVVPSESLPGWRPAVLQAQAVAARTYVMRRRDASPTSTWDVHDDTRSQMYKGLSSADPSTDAAIAATADRVLTYDGALADTLYHSTSGGYTENAENVYGGAPVPYLVAVPDPHDDVSPLHRWSDPPVFTASALGARLGVGGPVATFAVTKRAVSPRVMSVQVTTAGGATTTLTGAQVKARLGLRDTWFWVTRSDQARPTPEPPLPGAAPAPATPARPAARTPVSQVARRGRWMVIVVRTRSRALAAAAARRVARVRPARVMFRRGRAYVVATGRYATRAEAQRERAALRRRRVRASVIPAMKGDPVVRGRRWPAPRAAAAPAPATTTTGVPAPAASRAFRAVAADVATQAEADAVVRRLRGHRPAPRVVSQWTPVAGTRYLVVTLASATADRAAAEARALAAAGFANARAEPVPAP